jgi:hypothetical protein
MVTNDNIAGDAAETIRKQLEPLIDNIFTIPPWLTEAARIAKERRLKIFTIGGLTSEFITLVEECKRKHNETLRRES